MTRTMKIILKRGLSNNWRNATIDEGELVYLTDTKQLVTSDGAGGVIVLAEVFEADGQLCYQNPDRSFSPLYIKSS